jgi:hypothetical protein
VFLVSANLLSQYEQLLILSHIVASTLLPTSAVWLPHAHRNGVHTRFTFLKQRLLHSIPIQLICGNGSQSKMGVMNASLKQVIQ